MPLVSATVKLPLGGQNRFFGIFSKDEAFSAKKERNNHIQYSLGVKLISFESRPSLYLRFQDLDWVPLSLL